MTTKQLTEIARSGKSYPVLETLARDWKKFDNNNNDNPLTIARSHRTVTFIGTIIASISSCIIFMVLTIAASMETKRWVYHITAGFCGSAILYLIWNLADSREWRNVKRFVKAIDLAEKITGCPIDKWESVGFGKPLIFSYLLHTGSEIWRGGDDRLFKRLSSEAAMLSRLFGIKHPPGFYLRHGILCPRKDKRWPNVGTTPAMGT